MSGRGGQGFVLGRDLRRQVALLRRHRLRLAVELGGVSPPPYHTGLILGVAHAFRRD